MIRLLLLSASLIGLLTALPARAEEENVIKIIQPDGSVVVVEMPGPERPAAPEDSMPPGSEDQPHVFRAPEDSGEEFVPVEPEAPEAAPAPVKKAPPAPKAPKTAPPPKPVPTKAESEGRILEPAPAPQPALPPAPGQEITREMAIEIAMRASPPVRSLNVVRRMYQDKPVFVVQMRTDEGPLDVLIDVVTGEIVATAQ